MNGQTNSGNYFEDFWTVDELVHAIPSTVTEGTVYEVALNAFANLEYDGGMIGALVYHADTLSTTSQVIGLS